MKLIYRLIMKNPYLLPVIIGVIGGIFIVWYTHRIGTELTEFAALENAKSYSQAFSEFHTYYADIILENIRDTQGITISDDYANKKGHVPTPGLLSTDLAKRVNSQKGVIVRFLSQSNAPWKEFSLIQDDFEKSAFDYLTKHPNEAYFRVDKLENECVFRYAEPILIQNHCHHCALIPLIKNAGNAKNGIIGIEEIILPLNKIKEKTKYYVMCMAIVMTAGTALALLLLYITLHSLQASSRKNKELLDKLEEHNTGLEKVIKERTFDLEEKNKHIEETLQNLKDAQQQLVLQEKMASIGMLSAGIAHEIKNPLNFINNFADMTVELVQELKDELAKPLEQTPSDTKQAIDGIIDDIVVNCKKINEHGKRAESTIKNMLIQARTSEVDKAPVDINALLEEYLNLAYHGMRAQNNQFNVKMEKKLDKNIAPITASQQSLGRVFLNIINNGLYAAYDKYNKVKETTPNFMPTITIESKQDQDNITVIIKDNGNGIPEELKTKIFEPFFTTKPAGQGTGLGLPICYDIVVEEHNGQLEVNSTPNQFTEFVITLPKVVSN